LFHDILELISIALLQLGLAIIWTKSNPALIVVLFYSYIEICLEKYFVKVSSHTHDVGVAIIGKVRCTDPLLLIQRRPLFAILSSVEHGKLQKQGILPSCPPVRRQHVTAIAAASVGDAFVTAVIANPT
jgi:hypothetical protein